MSDRPSRIEQVLRRAVDETARQVAPSSRRQAERAVKRGRSRRRRAVATRVVGIAASLGLFGGAATLIALQLRPGEGRPGTTVSPSCESGQSGFGSQGALAYVHEGSLRVMDISSRNDREVVKHGVAGPVRWDPSGQWIAFQDTGGSVALTPAAGGSTCHPIGEGIVGWSWSPAGLELAGVTSTGGLVVGGPDGDARSLLVGSGFVGSPSFDPSGRRVAVASEGGVSVVDVRTGRAGQVYDAPSADPAVPIVAGWSPDGRWILFWLTPTSADPLDGAPLEAVPIDGGAAVEVVSSMLPRTDFLETCGSDVVIASGGGRDVATGKRLVSAAAPDWRATALPPDQGGDGNGIWPTCTPDGRFFAADVLSQLSDPSRAFGLRWDLVIVDRASGAAIRMEDPRPPYSDEAPRWAIDGTALVFVRRTLGSGQGWVYVLPIESGPTPGGASGMLADLGVLSDDGGYFAWSDAFDWFQGST